MKKIILFTLLLGLSISPVLSQQIKDVTHNFIKHYENRDFEKMFSLFSTDAEFQDPTTVVFGMSGDPMKGRDQIKEYFTKNMGDDFVKVKIDIIRESYVGNLAILNLNFKSDIKAKYFGSNKEGLISIDIPMTTILKFNSDNEIVSHIDYADYTKYMKQVNDQK
ncbi:MAG: nuclear transport factor 2 family protein [Fulvivirga sp.]|uniref:nuclear transport factor 2 family protein n=1 Tax=Fulvivirga sp. TaxID=1931237 RepID=UPI0032EE44AD